MRYRLGNVMLAGVLTCTCLFSACGTKNTEMTDSGSVRAEEEMGSAAGPSATPIAMEPVEANPTPPSGGAVERKYEMYKVIRGVNLRSDCSGDSELVGSLFAGDEIQGIGVCENGWLQLMYEGNVCYATGSCFEETGDSGSGEAALPATDMPTAMPTVVPEVTVDVTAWAKYTSSKWESDDTTSCRLQIHSVAGNQVVFSMEVIDGTLDAEGEDTLRASVENCYGKIEHGVMGFAFTDSYGNIGVGSLQIVDDTHLNLTTFVNQPVEGAQYRAEIMTELTEVE